MLMMEGIQYEVVNVGIKRRYDNDDSDDISLYEFGRRWAQGMDVSAPNDSYVDGFNETCHIAECEIPHDDKSLTFTPVKTQQQLQDLLWTITDRAEPGEFERYDMNIQRYVCSFYRVRNDGINSISVFACDDIDVINGFRDTAINQLELNITMDHVLDTTMLT